MRIATALAISISVLLGPVAYTQGPSSPTTRDAVTFTRDIAPILQNRCQVCHQPGTAAPMSLRTFSEVRPWARAIRQKVVAREMPPWHIDRNVGVQHFSNDISLSDRELQTIVRWVDAGAPEGNPTDMPPPRQFESADVWHIGTPDLLVSLPKDIVVAAAGPDRWPDVLVDPGLTEDRYLQGVQIIPTKGFRVIHHIRTSLVAPESEAVASGATDGTDGPALGEQGVFLNEYAIGKKGDVFPEGAARLIKAGTLINFQFHMHANGQETPANVALGLKFFPKGYVPKHVIVSTTFRGAGELDIRPNADNVRADAYVTLSRPAKVLSFQPHMHNRGKAACMEAILPTGRVETLSCAKFYFNWHINYVYADAAAPLLPAGTVLHAISWHDNSAKNPYNNDPDALITWGQRTIDEMAEPWISYYYMSESEYQAELAARRARPAAQTSAR
jgi:hypothetical protein